MAVAVKKKIRKRLGNSTSATSAAFRKNAINEKSNSFIESLTPEALAYALPGGLARLAYPKWLYNPFLKDIENKILCLKDNISVKFMFSAPPRHGKTVFVDRIIAPWYLGHNPDKRVLLVTYQDGFSRTQSRHARNIFKRFGPSVFNLRVADDTQAANQWDIQDHEGGMEAVGAGGAITGKGADLLIIDDLIKGREQALNENILEDHWEWFLTDVMSRLEPGASVLIIMTRWTNSDIIGKIQDHKVADVEKGLGTGEQSFEEFSYFNYPALALEDDILGREVGQALFPQRYSRNDLIRIKNRYDDDYWWEALYQGSPVPRSGDIIDINGLLKNNYDKVMPRSAYDMIIISADTASKETELADYSVFGVWGIYGEWYHLLDIIREKFAYPRLVEQAKTLNALWKPEFFLVEDKGSGISLIQDLREDLTVNVYPMDPGNESKVIRMQAETTTVKAGKIVLPVTAQWKENFLMECRSFPRGKKDQVDMMSQTLKFLRQTSTGIRMF